MKNLKKYVSVTLSIITCLSLCSCGKAGTDSRLGQGNQVENAVNEKMKEEDKTKTENAAGTTATTVVATTEEATVPPMAVVTTEQSSETTEQSTATTETASGDKKSGMYDIPEFTVKPEDVDYDNVDYFLIQREEINWAQQRGILTGVGRGSAGGSLVLYLLGITYIDPLKYDLIFERFLLPERAGLEPADVTMMCEGVDSDEWVEIELDNGKAYRFDKDSEFLVKRGDETVRVFADELRDGDDIVWDRRDELFTLEETGDDDALQGASEQTNNVKR